MENVMVTKSKTGTKIKGLPKLIAKQSSTTEVDNDLQEIICLTSYPPQQCGIATYTMDLQKSLKEKFGDSFHFKIYALESGLSDHEYPQEVAGRINVVSTLDFMRAAERINSNPRIGLVFVQHEFGLFHKNELGFHSFLNHLKKPIVVTFHTVLPDPSPELKAKVETIARSSAGIVVMTQTSEKILVSQYGIPKDKITVIPHGTHLIAYEDKNALKEKYDLTGRTVLSTFGLLGPGKSIETTLNALPSIIDRHPDVIFLIIGRTHPTLVKEQGEVYRTFLKERVDTMGLNGHIRFVDQFVPLENLLEYLQLTDIYLFTSKDPNQAVSGTFAYALSCGCPIVSTPIPHALEVLQNGAGSIFDFEDSLSLQETVLHLLGNSGERAKKSLNGLNTSSVSAWQNVAISHTKFFGKILEGRLQIQYQLPPIDLKHLKRMTTKAGMIQFSRINQPDIESGYTLDDNARALITICQHYELTGDDTDIEYIKIYFNFVHSCFRPDSRFLNCVNKEFQFTEENDAINLEDAGGRALWALGYFLKMSGQLPEEYAYLKEKAKFVFEQAIAAMEDVHSPRAMAFIIKGLYYYNKFEEKQCVNTAVIHYSDRLVSLYRSCAAEDWHWFENNLTYGNSVMPQALLMSYCMTLNSEYGKIARESFDFLLSKIFREGTIRVISNQYWHKRGESFNTEFTGGEQPIDVAYTILALNLFQKIYPNSGYRAKMSVAFEWFLGRNPKDRILYNPCTAGCYDGLELHGANLNQGAESTICYLLARMAFENMDKE
tara:strand:+ start:38465 stop:40786 length:2322 start_codon:yes stop_codon:yes gene_type:complete